MLFLEFLASEKYNDTIIEHADALPPNPTFMQKESYHRPPQYSNEWGCHEVFTRAVEEITAPPAHSPFIAYDTVTRILFKWQDKFDVGLCSAEEAAAETQREINAEMERNRKEIPALQGLYEAMLKDQSKFDSARSASQAVQASWVHNPYYQFVGRKAGWIQE